MEQTAKTDVKITKENTDIKREEWKPPTMCNLSENITIKGKLNNTPTEGTTSVSFFVSGPS